MAPMKLGILRFLDRNVGRAEAVFTLSEFWIIARLHHRNHGTRPAETSAMPHIPGFQGIVWTEKSGLPPVATDGKLTGLQELVTLSNRFRIGPETPVTPSGFSGNPLHSTMVL